MASSNPSTFLDEPLSAPPPGQHSDFVHPPSRASQLYITAGTCMSLILIFAALRFYSKVFIKKKRTWDDLTCTLGLLAAIIFISVSVATVSGGVYGLHQWDITLRQFSNRQLLLWLICQCIVGPCFWFIRLSLFVLYLEVFGLLRWLRYLAFGGMIATGLFYFATSIAWTVACSPRHGHSRIAYITAQASPQCLRLLPLYPIYGVVSVLSDLYLIILPLPAVWSLQLPLLRKLGVSAMFLTGSIACVASIISLYYRIESTHTTDTMWTIIPTWVTSIVEATAGIIVCCMPTTAATVGHIKGPISALLATSLKGLRSFTKVTTSTSYHEILGSTTNLRPAYSDSTPQQDGRKKFELQKP